MNFAVMNKDGKRVEKMVGIEIYVADNLNYGQTNSEELSNHYFADMQGKEVPFQSKTYGFEDAVIVKDADELEEVIDYAKDCVINENTEQWNVEEDKRKEHPDWFEDIQREGYKLFRETVIFVNEHNTQDFEICE